MLDDRPDMQDVVPPSHAVVSWLIEGFNGDRLGQRIYWSGNSPQSGRSAEHGPAFEGYSPYIVLSGGLETTPIDKWASVVFEMFNLENSEEFDRVADAAISGEDDGDTYAEKCVRLEFSALVKTNEYFAKNPLPASAHGKDEWYLWVTTSLGTFEEYQRSFDVPGSTTLNSNFAYFKEYYDTTLVPFKDAMQKAK